MELASHLSFQISNRGQNPGPFCEIGPKSLEVHRKRAEIAAKDVLADDLSLR